MTNISSAFIDSVKSLSVNGSTYNGDAKPYNVRKICCVGAGYVGMSYHASSMS